MSMRATSISISRALFAAAIALALASPAFAAGPLAKCHSGQPFLWADGGTHIPFNPDQGDLGPLTHAQAVAATQSAFDTWGAVPSSTVAYVQGAELPVDVDITNFGPYLEPDAPDGLSAIVFDDTGEIFDLLFGPDSGVLGFAGPEWVDETTCTIAEGVSFLNGPSFDDLVAAQDVMVHEFGHYTNLAHTVVNGQVLGFDDTSGPTPNNTFGNPPSVTVIETMYPFYFGPGSGTNSPHADDIASVSQLYPAATFAATTGSIAGAIKASDGVTRLSGVNVIARNVANPFLDAVSAISGDFTDGTAQSDPVVGTYRLRGLTPGAQYAVYVDQILDGGFSTEPITLPNAEEFYNGAAESNNGATDNPSSFTPVASVAAVPRTGIDIIFNAFRAGDPLPVGDDDSVTLPLPFPFKMCGQEFSSVFVNANGSLTFGAASPDFSESVNELLGGVPRIAGLWDDLDARTQGTVSFDQTPNTFTVTWDDVPEFGAAGGSNTFSISLKKSSNQVTIDYGDLSATDGLAGVSCGSAVTSQFENEQSLRGGGHRRTIDMNGETAAFEIFTAADNDLDGYELSFVNLKRGFDDVFEPNNRISRATRIHLPFSTESMDRYSAIAPVGGDADYYRFSAKAGDILALEVVRGGFDSVLGVFDSHTGELLAVDDDGGGGLLSRLLLQANVDLDLTVAVSAFPDVTFTGAGEEGGRYVLTVNSYRGEILPAGDDTSTPVPLGFNFRFQGTNWNSVFVNSNGNLTFGAGSGDFSETVPELLTGAPRIAPLWDDLDASGGLVIAERGPQRLSVHYVSVPEFLSDAGNYFSVHLLPLSLFALEYGATARSDSLVGFTPGNGAADPGESDLSAAFPIQSGRGTRYEQFVGVEPFDLSFRQMLFVPLF
jgi:hypothetical protein